MTNTDESAAPVAESNETPPDGRRTVVVGLAIGLVLCLLLAVGVAFLARKQVRELTHERDAARGELQKATAENAARMERVVPAARRSQLRRLAESPRRQAGEPEPGDILFFDSGIVMLYLGGDNAVGMLPEGAVTKTGVIKGRGIGFKYMGHGTIRYD